jgi:phenolic acid decarboxylase
MNERIWDFFKQSGIDVAEDQESNIEKFARLIVRECAVVAIKKQTENDIDNIVSKNPAKDFANALIKHFGIKE